MTRVRRFCSMFTIYLLLCIEVSFADDSSRWVEQQENQWGLFSLNPVLRHSLERASLNDGRLELRVWYEDTAITKGGTPGGTIFCRIAHSLIYGGYRLRSKQTSLPIDSAFNSSKALKSVSLTFFSVTYRNKPRGSSDVATLQDAPSPRSEPLRVHWTREEAIVPYLTLTISRQEWASVSSIVKKSRPQNFKSFRDSLCEPVLRITPNLKANFLALTPQAEETINLVVEDEVAE